MFQGTIFVPIKALMVGKEMVPETSEIFNQLTWLIAREDFINWQMLFII
jgi:hypothetical protein